MMTLTKQAPVVADPKALWPQVQVQFYAQLRQNGLQQVSLDAMLVTLRFYDYEASSGRLWMLVGSKTPKSWLEGAYLGLLTACWKEVLPGLKQVLIELGGIKELPGKRSSELHDVQVGRHVPVRSPLSEREARELAGLRKPLPGVAGYNALPPRMTADQIPPELFEQMMVAAQVVCRHHGVELEHLRKKIFGNLRRLRMVAIYLIRQTVGEVDEAYIRAFFGGLGKTTVATALTQTEERCQKNHNLSLDIATMVEEVKVEITKPKGFKP